MFVTRISDFDDYFSDVPLGNDPETYSHIHNIHGIATCPEKLEKGQDLSESRQLNPFPFIRSLVPFNTYWSKKIFEKIKQN